MLGNDKVSNSDRGPSASRLYQGLVGLDWKRKTDHPFKLVKRSQQFVLIAYCVLIVGCCVWVPWHIRDDPPIRIGYGWVWNGLFKLEGQMQVASPDFSVIGLCILAATAACGCLDEGDEWPEAHVETEDGAPHPYMQKKPCPRPKLLAPVCLW